MSATHRWFSPSRISMALGAVVGLILLVLLAWTLWWWLFHPVVYFVALPMVGNSVLAPAPLPFVAEDIETFSRLSPDGRAVVLADLQTSQSISTLAGRLQALGAKEKDTLILYLRACGVSNDGEASLLCSDSSPNPLGGRCAVAELLGQIAKCPAGKKLLILDAGDLAYDPRLGMIVNEFPQLLDGEVRRVGDPTLWVLASNLPLEVSHASESSKRSALGCFVAEGIAGAADRNGDGTIGLAELVAFVRNGVAHWVEQQSGDVETQTPWLLQGGKGTVRAPADLALLPVSGRSQDERGPDTGNPGSVAGNADSEAQAAKQVAALLEEAWRLRDQIERRSAVAPWTPVDYAPHLWRAYQESLLSYERRSRSGAEYDPAKLADDLRTDILPLADLLANPSPPAAGKATIASRVADAHMRFLAKSKDQRFERLAKDKRIGRYWELVRVKNELVLRAYDYVRWHAAASRNTSERHRLYQPIYDFLVELGPFVNQLEWFEGAAPELAKNNQVDEALKGLDLPVQTLQASRKAIEEDGLHKEAAELIDRAAKTPTAKGIAGPIDALLATPLLPAPLRQKLLRAREGLEQPLAVGDQSADGTLQFPSLLRWSGQLYDQAVLERQLIGLAEPNANFPPLQSANTPTVRALLTRYRGLGKLLGQFYSRLPTEINRNFRSGAPAVVRRCARWLRAVDARDAQQIDPSVAAMTVRPPQFSPPAGKPPAAARTSKPK